MRLLALVALLAVSCTRESGAPPTLKAASETAAVEVVRAFLDAAQAGDAAQVAGKLCGAPGDALAHATAALGGPLRIRAYQIDLVEPAWIGAEPYFRVEVTLRRTSDSEPRALSVRAREGCIDRLLGDPVVGAKRADPNEISL